MSLVHVTGPTVLVQGPSRVISGQTSTVDGVLRAGTGIVYASGGIVQGPRQFYGMQSPMEAYEPEMTRPHINLHGTILDSALPQAVAPKSPVASVACAAPPAAHSTTTSADWASPSWPASATGELSESSGDTGPGPDMPDVTQDGGSAPSQAPLPKGWSEAAALDAGVEMSDPFMWIRRDNSGAARIARREISKLTCQVVEAGGYAIGSKRQRLEHVQEMTDGTVLLARSLGNATGPSRAPPFYCTKLITHPPSTVVLEAALQLLGRHQDREGVAVVSAASAYQCGGGFSTGGRHALEEALCTQTTLYASLTQMHTEILDLQEEGEFDAGYIPSDGVVLSPKVEFFREGSDQGYRFMDQPELLKAVISVAMFNRNPHVRDAPLDAPSDSKEYERVIKDKFRSVLCGALFCKCSALVVPDVGCGVYKNDPAVIGRLFGEVLRREFWGHIQEVALCGQLEFQHAVQEAVEVWERKSADL